MSCLYNALTNGFRNHNLSLHVVYDLDSPLSRLIYEDILQGFPSASFRLFSEDYQEDIRKEILSKPQETIIVLVQSTRFRLSPFRFRLEVFDAGLFCIEFPHLIYIPETQHQTFMSSLQYTDYTPYKRYIEPIVTKEPSMILSSNGNICHFGIMEPCVPNDMEWHSRKNKGGTLPAGELFTECKDLTSMNGKIDIIAYPDFSYQVHFLETPVTLDICEGKVVSFDHVPYGLFEVLDTIKKGEGEVFVREIGMGLNASITRKTPIADINACERMMGLHLSFGKKHTHFRKKIPSLLSQKYHIDCMLDVESFISESQNVLFSQGRFFSSASS